MSRRVAIVGIGQTRHTGRRPYQNDGEMIYHKEEEKDRIEIDISSPAPKPQDNLCYMIASFKPQKGSRGFCYHDSDEPVTLPKYISHNPYDIPELDIREVALSYNFKTSGFNLYNSASITFEKKENLERKLEKVSK